ncbi:MAG: choline dehydrogenase [Ilumatobacter sp.]|uniref:choline dehydrogenase n=1 Tax=Ilumatobacter sp. TaxID=1967498 RepID=UPI003C739014
MYDYVIVGGGSAGCALANRLSADSTKQVLLIEAGRRDWKWDVFIHMPAALAFPIGSRFYDWKYESEPEPHMGGRRVYHARGKVLGGSSSINGMIFQRGNPMDYDKWGAMPGLEHWDWAHCLPYFKRMETTLEGQDPSQDGLRGEDGPLALERGPAENPLFDAWLTAGVEAGFNRTDDVNGYRQEGFAPFDKNVSRGRRLSAARAYLHPVLDRPNLTLMTRAQVDKVLFEDPNEPTRATGVAVRKLGVAGLFGRRPAEKIRAREVVLSGGAFNSPQLLQLSGVGDREHLESLDIPVVAHVPGVGANLQDHLEVYIQYESKLPVSIQPHLAHWKKPWIGLQWLFRKGPGSSNHFEAGAFVKSNPSESYPNLMFHFLPIAIRYDGSSPGRPDGSGSKIEHGYQVHVGPMYSDARGTVKITTRDPKQHPAVLFNYLSTEQDRREWIEAVRTARRILTQPAFEKFNAGEISPGTSVETDQEIMDWVAKDSETALHPSCTTRIGAQDDPLSVLDPETMKVWGTEGLRVVDAGCMPNVSNGNTYAPTMMIAEKAADLILGVAPLPPDDTPVYRSDVVEGGRR